MDTRKLLDAHEAAARLGISRQTLYSYVSRGLIKAYPGKSYREHYYRTSDIERLCTNKQVGRKAGRIAEQVLNWGQPALASGITLICEHMIYYRGQALNRWQNQPFENCASHLWQCTENIFATEAPILSQAWQQLAARHDGSLWHSLALFALAARESDSWPHQDPHNTSAALLRLMCACLIGQPPTVAPIAAQLAMHWQTPAVSIRQLDLALILCADHELNASSFVARCATSAGSEAAAALLAALATLGGEKHGGSTWHIESMLDDYMQYGRLPTPDTDGQLAGFGHPLYPEGDPRASLLMSTMPDSTGQQLASAVRKKYGLRPGIDFALVALRRTLGLPVGAALTLFALGRTAGWLAHIMEHVARGSLIRPRATYDGPPPVQTPAAAQTGEDSTWPKVSTSPCSAMVTPGKPFMPR